MAAPLAVFVVSRGTDEPRAVALVREAMGPRVAAASCAGSAGAVTCRLADGSVCRYRVFAGRAAHHGGSLGYLTSAA